MIQRLVSRFWPVALGLAYLFLLASAPFITVPSLKAAPVEKPDQGLIWLVEDDTGRRMFLVGSFHLGKSDFYPLAPSVAKAFDEADHLIVEVDFTTIPENEIKDLFLEGYNPTNVTLQSQLSPETNQVLKDARLPGPLILFQAMRPWMAAVTVEALALAKKGFSERLGFDYYFITLANRRRMAVSELESAREQIRVFTDMSLTEQDLYLRSALLELDNEIHPLESYVGFWRKGDADAFYDALYDEYLKNVELAGVFKRLIFDRNVTLTARLIPFFRRPSQTYFVLVGAAHMVGPIGLPALMAKEGYKVTKL
jgi:uncharacterized protein YbaP (TraB family)